MKHEIEIPDLPEGWEPVAYKVPEVGEYYFGRPRGITLARVKFENLWLVVRKKQPLRGLHDPLRFAEGLIEQLPDDHEGAINWLMNHGEGDKAGKLRKKYSHPQTRRIVLEETCKEDRKAFLHAGKHWKIVEDNKCAE